MSNTGVLLRRLHPRSLRSTEDESAAMRHGNVSFTHGPRNALVTPLPDMPPARLLEQFSGTLRLARALLEARRTVDLDGLQDLAGRLCAACLDMPTGEARVLRPRLEALLAELDAIAVACRAGQETGR
jgi:hypothetical protein